jgi:nitrate reductase molybdenum cofactor assembly chaperone
MRASTAVHDALARLLQYPSAGFAERAAGYAATVAGECPEAGADVAEFARFVSSHELGECEEMYVRTFDVNAERALEVGWQVFGEQYARGAFLVRMRELLREFDVPESYELPDHMTHVLRLLPRIDEAQAATLVESAVAPALRRIRADLTDPANPYTALVRGIARAAAPEALREEATA